MRSHSLDDNGLCVAADKTPTHVGCVLLFSRALSRARRVSVSHSLPVVVGITRSVPELVQRIVLRVPRKCDDG
jgi:hypothetical protein